MDKKTGSPPMKVFQNFHNEERIREISIVLPTRTIGLRSCYPRDTFDSMRKLVMTVLKDLEKE